MKGEGSTSSIQGIQNSAAIAIAALSVFILSLLAFAPVIHADTQCDQATTTAMGGYFTAYQSDEYSNGLLVQRFKNNPTYPYVRTTRLRWNFFDEMCNSIPFYTAGPYVDFTLPQGITDWSIRFTTSSHFEVWDDDHHVIVASSTDPFFLSYPSYASISFVGAVEPTYITGTYFTARTNKIVENGTAPTMIDTLPTPDGCPPFFASNLFDSTYEHAEYVDGLLRVHVRFGSPAYSGQWVRTKTLAVPSSCNRDSQIYPTPWHGVSLPIHMKYFSFRMTSPTHWILWDDETDTKITCTPWGADNWSDGCEGDLDPSSPYISFYMDIGSGSVATLMTTPFPPVQQGCTENCNSNVLFLPGIEASRLYIPDPLAFDGNDRLWEPTSDADGRALFMDEHGVSVRNDIYTKDVIDEAYGTFNVYKSFLADLETWKNTDHIIADYSAVPYDWRLTLDEILDYGHQTLDGHIHYSGTDRATSTPYIIQELKRLSASSRNDGKVTIIAHSNGGLVAKALLKRLQDTNDPLLEKVDVVIMVAVPQTGTPVAIGALLHGYRQGIPFDLVHPLLSPQVAREFSYNDPMAYHLLPSAAYFNGEGATIQTPLVTFNNGAATQVFINHYGNTVENAVELHDFLLGAEGRPLATVENLNEPTVLRAGLLSYGETVHQSLDIWTLPAHIIVHEIAGWGEDTMAGIIYDNDRKCVARTLLLCTQYMDTLRYKPDLVVDGDGTVVVPSALMMSTSTVNVKRWWVDLEQFNADHRPTPALPNLNHASILEISELRSIIENIIIASSSSPLPRYVRDTIPPADDTARLRFFLHSPLALSATDATGQEISASTSTIPGARYKRFGEVQYISVPASAAPMLHLEGFAAGSFTLEVQEVMGDTVTATTTFLGIPNATTTTASMNFGDGTIENASPLVVDIDADGTTDITLEPKVGEMIVPDTTPPEIQITFATSTNVLTFIGIDDMGTTTVSVTTTYPTLKKHQKEPKGVATTTVTVRDQAGNTTVLVYTEKLPSPDKRDTIFLKEVSYNGATTTLSDTSVSYKWRTDKNGLYKLFASHIKTNATSTESHYRPKKNQTAIMTKPIDLDDDESDDDVDSRPAKQKLPGMIIPSVLTEKGRVLVSY